MRKGFLLAVMLLLGFFSFGIDVKVSLFNGLTLTEVSILQVEGRYMLISDDHEITTLSQGDGVTFFTNDSMIVVMEHGIIKASAKKIMLVGLALSNSLSIKVPGLPIRCYEDHLVVQWQPGSMRIINQIELEKYIGGVIQAEAGGSTNLTEYFKVQAIVSRTYAMRMVRMNGQDFCLTDDVNNQVYKGKPVKPEILTAVAQTTGEVILFDDTNLINAVFHSNSGGFTMASNDVWMASLPYLKPVVDSFSIAQRNYTWTRSIPIVEYLDYLEKNWGFPVQNDSLRTLALNYSTDQRSKYFLHQIPLAKLRTDLNLKSTFFSTTINHDKVVFNGRGYGHGVGLSQEGAIRMAELGYPAHDILKFYYAGITIRSLSDIPATVAVE